MSLVSSLAIGVSALVVIFIGLKIMTPIRSVRIALIEAFIIMGLYTPYAMLHWPGVDVFAMHVGIFLITCYILGMLGSRWDKRDQNDGDKKWFHWAPAAIIGFFVVLVIVDSFFVTVATKGVSYQMAKWLLPEPGHPSKHVESHFPGVVERDYRRKDSDYIDYEKKLRAQQKLGWQINYGWLQRDYPVINQAAVFQLQLRDKQNQPVHGATISGTFLRLSNHKKDIPFRMRAINDDLFQTQVVFTEPGRWNVFLRIERGTDQYEIQSDTTVLDTPVTQ